ncbi:unnamed protein product [Ixodes pacificus]
MAGTVRNAFTYCSTATNKTEPPLLLLIVILRKQYNGNLAGALYHTRAHLVVSGLFESIYKSVVLQPTDCSIAYLLLLVLMSKQCKCTCVRCDIICSCVPRK